MRRQLVTSVLATVVLIVVLGVGYPLVMTGIAQLAFKSQADGSPVSVGSHVVGSRLIGQAFSDASGQPIARYFQPRPSAAGKGYDPTSSGGTQLGPTNAALRSAVAERAAAYRRFNRLPAGAPVPVDAVTTSGSGLDPDISEANALDQVARVAAARGLAPDRVTALVRAHVDHRPWGFLGEASVNVLDLNLALDRLG